MNARSPFPTAEEYSPRNFFQFHEPRDRGDNLIQEEREKESGKLGAGKFQGERWPTFQQGPVTAIETRFLSRENDGIPLLDGRFSAGGRPRNHPANPIRGTITTEFSRRCHEVSTTYPFKRCSKWIRSQGYCSTENIIFPPTFLRSHPLSFTFPRNFSFPYSLGETPSLADPSFLSIFLILCLFTFPRKDTHFPDECRWLVGGE